jgi:hypothetical protein
VGEALCVPARQQVSAGGVQMLASVWTGAWAQGSEAALPEDARTISRPIAADAIRRIFSEDGGMHAARSAPRRKSCIMQA